ncbi:trypsin-like peptidase domain-containing protein [Kitasatospora sp. NPDC058170]|uniref:trypsin-like peptidase domain-containing protein n=1 Tax=Kitasatospora sp. NPDC058170 TaxID=3346364 RepID=UPI0036D79979
MVDRGGAPHGPAVWLSDAAMTFLGSGFYAGPGLVVTCAHVVYGRGPVAVHGALGAQQALSVTRWPADPPAGAAYYPAPDLAVLRTAVHGEQPVAVLAAAEAPVGAELSAHGFTTVTATDGVQPDSARLTVVGPSGEFVRLASGWIRKGLSGSMLIDPGDRRVVGVVKGTEDDGDPVGGWMTPLGLLRQVVDLPSEPPPAPPHSVRPHPAPPHPAPPRPSAGRQEWADTLHRIPALDEERVRHDLVRRINDALPPEGGIRPRADSLALPHLEQIAGACLDNLDPCAALGALVAAMRRLAGGHRAVGELEIMLDGCCGGGGR